MAVVAGVALPPPEPTTESMFLGTSIPSLVCLGISVSTTLRGSPGVPAGEA